MRVTVSLDRRNPDDEEWDAKGQTYETLAICRSLALARAAFKIADGRVGPGLFCEKRRLALAYGAASRAP
jgi:hypothetical protein